MNKETRKLLCPKCLKAVQNSEKVYQRKVRKLKIKQTQPQVSGKINIKQ